MVLRGGFPPSPCAYAPLYARQAITLGGNQTMRHAVGRGAHAHSDPHSMIYHTASACVLGSTLDVVEIPG